MFAIRLVNLDGTPADKRTFRSGEPDWHVGDKMLVRPGTEYRILAVEAAPPDDMHGVRTVEPVPNGH
jgi:hypothetical protein